MSRSAAIVLAAVLFAAPVASASTITFNTVPNSVYTAAGDGFSTDGFQFLSLNGDFMAVFDQSSCKCASDGSRWLGSFNQSGIVMKPSAGGTFAFNGFDASETFWDTSFTAADYIQLTGTFAGGATETTRFALDRLNDGPGGVQDFQTFAFAAPWSGLTSLAFTGIRVTNGSDFAIDNVRVNEPVPVPEPASLLLLGTGLLGGAIRARRKSAA